MIQLVFNFIRYRMSNLRLRLRILLATFQKSAERQLFVIGTAEHPNYGDFAISIAQQLFLEHYVDGKIIEYSEEEISRPLTYRLIEKQIKPGDIIFLQGGGNFGNVYHFHEGYRRKVISQFRNNKIVLFPQTMFFTDDEEGKKELELSQKTYNAHPDLVLALREKESFHRAQEAFPNAKVIFCPDIVLYLNKTFEKKDSNGKVLMLLRVGKEEKFPQAEKDKFIETLKKDYPVEFNDHGCHEKINASTRLGLFRSQVELYANYSVVITDKLHGAIFTILSGTPCIMLPTLSHKISSTYSLFQNTEGYYLAESAEEVCAFARQAVQIQKCDTPDLTAYYDALAQTIIQ